MAEMTKKAPQTALERGLAKRQALRELYAKLVPENGGHRPLTADERKVQRDNALTVEERQAVQKHLYGQFVATERIYHNGALAYAPGHRVPSSAVEKYGYEADGLVARVQPAVS